MVILEQADDEQIRGRQSQNTGRAGRLDIYGIDQLPAGKLPATIRSRCQQLQMRSRLPDPAVAQQWLAAESNGMDTASSSGFGCTIEGTCSGDSGLLGMRVKLLGEFADIIESKGPGGDRRRLEQTRSGTGSGLVQWLADRLSAFENRSGVQ